MNFWNSNKKIITAFLLIFALNIFPQKIKVEKIEPPNWWTGMKWNKVQLMIYGENLDNLSAYFNNSKFKVEKIYRIKNHYYGFIDVEIPKGIKAGTYKLIIRNSTDSVSIDFPIFKRSNDLNSHQGFSDKDVIYLITPDRFSNGDTSNDVVRGMINEYDPEDPYGRHGGDLQGIINHLDYLKDLGVSALWINPVVENNTTLSYHGYAATDLYKIDPRLGTNILYKKLVNEAHKRRLKIIFDHVNNHVSYRHPWVSNMPTTDWLNGTITDHFITQHNKTAFADIHSDKNTVDKIIKGWFTDSMADLNQSNEFVKNYLIQNTLWWIEFAGIDGIREDTYPYSDQKFLSEWAKAIENEFPDFNIVGEVWINSPPFLSFYQSKSPLRINSNTFDSNLPCVTDFALSFSIRNFIEGTGTISDIYKVISQDFLYSNPNNLLTFIDNHDMPRLMYLAKNNLKKAELALTLLLTTRGIPEILYGTEIGMVGAADDGRIRSDFPGGFSGDIKNAFLSTARTKEQNEIFNFLKNLIRVRKDNPALSDGKLVHLPPVHNIYYYLRTNDREKILIILNANDTESVVNLESANDQIKSDQEFRDLLNNNDLRAEDFKIKVSPTTALILKLN